MAELQKDALLQRIRENCFAAHECALYLDCHPGSAKALSMHAKYMKAANELTAEYERDFGPLTSGTAGADAAKGWTWVEGKWPWQNRED
ncbi:MAG: spore coat protein CotJB [Clostridia bacterium]|nr:spore coat protein CotJB [Clostridia bacterium]